MATSYCLLEIQAKQLVVYIYSTKHGGYFLYGNVLIDVDQYNQHDGGPYDLLKMCLQPLCIIL
jgi:hypothetical protein